jgi:hypothetical protein
MKDIKAETRRQIITRFYQKNIAKGKQYTEKHFAKKSFLKLLLSGQFKDLILGIHINTKKMRGDQENSPEDKN